MTLPSSASSSASFAKRRSMIFIVGMMRRGAYIEYSVKSAEMNPTEKAMGTVSDLVER